MIGLGYVGLTTAVVLAELGRRVCGVDIDKCKVERLRRGESPLYEPGLAEKLERHVREGRLRFDSDWTDALASCPVIFLTVGTPPAADGSPDLRALTAAADALAPRLRRPTLVVVKSTVPPGTCDWLASRLRARGAEDTLLEVAANPEFLREGSAIRDSLQPDRIIAGVRSDRAAAWLRRAYAGIDAPFLRMSPSAAEMTKYASNAFLAAKISFANELARTCDAMGIDVDDVTLGMGYDARIGPRFLQAGIGYGGSCFPKDVAALQHAAGARGVETPLLRAVREINDTQVEWCLRKLEELAGAEGAQRPLRQVTVWGAAFKPGTDDVRESRAVLLMRRLAARGLTVHACDPLVRPDVPGVRWFDDRYASLDGSDALVLATEWPSLLDTQWEEAASRMRNRLLLDGRNAISREAAAAAGFRYVGVGRPFAKGGSS